MIGTGVGSREAYGDLLLRMTQILDGVRVRENEVVRFADDGEARHTVRDGFGRTQSASRMLDEVLAHSTGIDSEGDTVGEQRVPLSLHGALGVLGGVRARSLPVGRHTDDCMRLGGPRCGAGRGRVEGRHRLR